MFNTHRLLGDAGEERFRILDDYSLSRRGGVGSGAQVIDPLGIHQSTFCLHPPVPVDIVLLT